MERFAGGGGQGGGKVIGHFYIDQDGSRSDIVEKIYTDVRRAREFIMRVKGCYTESDLLKKDYLTFFRLLEESEHEQAEAVARMEKQAQD